MFAALHIGGEDTHVTIVLNADPNPNDVDEMVSYLKSLELPIVVVIEPKIVLKGHNNDVPTHNVYIVNDMVRMKLHDMYKNTYKQKEGFTPHPTLSAHVSVDKPERVKIVKKLLEERKGIVLVNQAYIKQLGKPEILFQINGF